MKRTTIFVLLLSVILSIGYYSTNIAEFLFHYDTTEQKNISRNDALSNAIYITAEREDFFTPMSILEFSDEKSAFEDRIPLCASYLINVSGFSHQNEYSSSVDSIELKDALGISSNDYIYAEQIAYYNTSGYKRYLDCIIDAKSLNTVYLRFYSENEKNDEQSLQSVDVDQSLKRFQYETEVFYQVYSRGIESFNNTFFNEFAEMIENRSQFIPFPYYYDYKSIDEWFRMVKVDNFGKMYEYSDFVNFWRMNLGLSCVFLGINDHYQIHMNGTSYITDAMALIGNYTKPTYSTYNGRIFQSINIGSSQLITIFNLQNGEFEGIYAPPSK